MGKRLTRSTFCSPNDLACQLQSHNRKRLTVHVLKSRTIVCIASFSPGEKLGCKVRHIGLSKGLISHYRLRRFERYANSFSWTGAAIKGSDVERFCSTIVRHVRPLREINASLGWMQTGVHIFLRILGFYCANVKFTLMISTNTHQVYIIDDRETVDTSRHKKDPKTSQGGCNPRPPVSDKIVYVRSDAPSKVAIPK